MYFKTNITLQHIGISYLNIFLTLVIMFIIIQLVDSYKMFTKLQKSLDHICNIPAHLFFYTFSMVIQMHCTISHTQIWIFYYIVCHIGNLKESLIYLINAVPLHVFLYEEQNIFHLFFPVPSPAHDPNQAKIGSPDYWNFLAKKLTYPLQQMNTLCFQRTWTKWKYLILTTHWLKFTLIFMTQEMLEDTALTWNHYENIYYYFIYV